jgi:hypothetical protein
LLLLGRLLRFRLDLLSAGGSYSACPALQLLEEGVVFEYIDVVGGEIRLDVRVKGGGVQEELGGSRGDNGVCEEYLYLSAWNRVGRGSYIIQLTGL